jgi:hypothetical protein
MFSRHRRLKEVLDDGTIKAHERDQAYRIVGVAYIAQGLVGINNQLSSTKVKRPGLIGALALVVLGAVFILTALRSTTGPIASERLDLVGLLVIGLLALAFGSSITAAKITALVVGTRLFLIGRRGLRAHPVTGPARLPDGLMERLVRAWAGDAPAGHAPPTTLDLVPLIDDLMDTSSPAGNHAGAPSTSQAPASAMPPPGWYEDTTRPGTRRWWSGTDWGPRARNE